MMKSSFFRPQNTTHGFKISFNASLFVRYFRGGLWPGRPRYSASGHHQPPHVLRGSESSKHSTLANTGAKSRNNPIAQATRPVSRPRSLHIAKIEERYGLPTFFCDIGVSERYGYCGVFCWTLSWDI